MIRALLATSLLTAPTAALDAGVSIWPAQLEISAARKRPHRVVKAQPSKPGLLNTQPHAVRSLRIRQDAQGRWVVVPATSALESAYDRVPPFNGSGE